MLWKAYEYDCCDAEEIHIDIWTQTVLTLYTEMLCIFEIVMFFRIKNKQNLLFYSPVWIMTNEEDILANNTNNKENRWTNL